MNRSFGERSRSRRRWRHEPGAPERAEPADLGAERWAQSDGEPVTEANLPADSHRYVGGMFANLGLALTRARERRGVSQAKVARLAGIGKSQLSKYENEGAAQARLPGEGPLGPQHRSIRVLQD